MKIAILGAAGMLGSMVLEVFSKNTDYQIIASARNKNDFDNRLSWKFLDAVNFTAEEIADVIRDCSWVINCIGLIKPYIDDNNFSDVEKAIEINTLFPYKLSQAAEKTGAKVIQIATDCVFDGTKGKYIETDNHNAVDVYGKTKSLGEVYSSDVINLRCSIIGFEKRNKKSLLEWFLNQPPNSFVKGYSNHFWNGVTTYHFAKICMGIIKSDFDFYHLQHIVPADFVSKAQLLNYFKEIFREDILIDVINTPENVDRTLLTVNEDKNNTLWQIAGYSSPPTIKRMVEELKDARI
ncbi:MAG: SDR family oxidoreductase [Candidatus Gastranaerophilales bacterium]|nr:SDR family oxidoreductase [Candidatus Gastranaerophilales bacterium]